MDYIIHINIKGKKNILHYNSKYNNKRKYNNDYNNRMYFILLISGK